MATPADGAPEAPPLAGVTVLDLTGNIAGPFATLVLRDMGARIIKVEPPGGDVARRWSPEVEGVSTVYAAFNRGKLSLGVDAKQARGLEVLMRLVERSDIFVESMRPGKAAQLGLAWEDLEPRNPGLIYASVNAYGATGPLGGHPGFDAIVQAYSGIMELTGEPDGPPSRVGAAVIDVGTGMWSALGIMGALARRARDGRGRQVEATMLGTAVGFLMHHLASVRLVGVVPRRLGTAQHNFAPYEAFQAADRLVMVGVNSDAMWRRTCEALHAEELVDDPRFTTNAERVAHRAELVEALEAATRATLADEVVARLAGLGVPSTVVRTVEELSRDEQLDALELWGTTTEGWPLARAPVTGSLAELGSVAPYGADTAAILAELGMEDELAELVKAGAVTVAAARPAAGRR